jgi:hypothetical protein
VDAKIIPIKLQTGFGMGGDDLKQVVFWDIQNVCQRTGDDQANLNSVFRRFAFKEVNANDRHACSFATLTMLSTMVCLLMECR